ncbi:hypothetical protein HJC23_007167 [Cyclotella cryptica]|uniref:protein-serine/threonine phosphatase n=1 Tax=Cyclotella cryptica TaxID=29204 RepID=A0ABD3QQI3_9STRA|eukprot:CCRYP_003420-RA/>CCRYP_003420-RA protein AED:0.17 eAED:-0.05 QI:0/-1/0/1/-1/1/1/0/556
MGNVASIDNDGPECSSRFSYSSASSNNGSSEHPLIARKGSSFLEEPVCIKHTERGEATMISPVQSKFKIKNSASKTKRDRLRFAVSEMQGWRSHMEDKHCICPPLRIPTSSDSDTMEDHYLFAIFDGHGGNFTSHFCGENLVQTLVKRDEWTAYLKLPKAPLFASTSSSAQTGKTRGDVSGIKLLKSALTSTFLTLDSEIMAAQRDKRLNQLDELESILSTDLDSIPEEHQQLFQTGSEDNTLIQTFAKPNPPSLPANVNLERSGSTGVVVLITPTHILCANAGDSRALLCRSGSALPLSFDHKPNNDWEAARIDRAGGFVKGGRVDGDLAVSRSFGDFSYKSHATCDATSQRVTVDPDIIVLPRDYDRDEYIVLACDGVWDRLTNRDCATLVRSCIDEGESDVGLLCEEIIDTALEMDSRDNMTAAVVVFPGAKMPSPYNDNLGVDVVVPGELAGVRKRRVERERKWGSGSTVAGRAHKRLEERRKKSKDLLTVQKLKEQHLQRHQQHSNKGSGGNKATQNKVAGTKHTVPSKGHGSKVPRKNNRTSTNQVIQVQ